MNPEEPKNQALEIALIQNDIKQLKVLSDKFDKVNDQLQECVTNISAILRIHESKIEDSSSQFKENKNLLESRRIEALKHVEDLHKRINDHLEEDLSMHSTIREDIKKIIKKVENRVAALERVKWIFIGAFIALSAAVEIVLNFERIKNLLIGGLS